MGAWGPGIFSDDTASDIRTAYRELIEDQVPDPEATRRVIEQYDDLDTDERHVLWLALAAAQSSLGRLDEAVKARALEVIDTGDGMERWEEAGPALRRRRGAALARLRAQLTGPQPARKVLRRPWRHVTDLHAGDVLAFTTRSGDTTLLRVLRVDDDRVGAAPIMAWLDWRGRSLPSPEEIDRLRTRPISHPLPDGDDRLELLRVARHRKKDPDWHDEGFTLVARVDARPEDATATAWTYTTWSSLAEDIERLTVP